MKKAKSAENGVLAKAKEPSAKMTNALSTSGTLHKAQMESCMFQSEL